MIVRHHELKFSTSHEGAWRNITEDINHLLNRWNADVGIVNIQVIGSTGALVSIECEKGLLNYDLLEIYSKLVPRFKPGKSFHEAKWQDGNAHSHIRASLFGAQISLNVVGSSLNIGKWQHVVFVEFDVQMERSRRLSIVYIGKTKK